MGLRRRLVAALLALWCGVALCGCAARWAYRQGESEARKGNWDMAVARLTRALQKDPENIRYKMVLENARIQASRMHYAEARKHLAADLLDKAADELDIASKYDPSNKSAADDLLLVRARIRKRDEEKERLASFDEMKARAQRARAPMPVLSPRSAVPITIKFADVALEKVFDTLSQLSGVNILLDQAFRREQRVSVNLVGVTFEEALDQLTMVNQLFYKVLDQNTIIIVPENVQKRRAYDENLVRTFYLQNADPTEVSNLLKVLAQNAKAVPSKDLGAVTVMGTPDELALAEHAIDAIDKARGEVMVEVEILEVNRNNLKKYGIELSNYQVAATFSPTGAAKENDNGFTTLRAHMLSSLDLSDWVVNIPSTLLTRFLQNDSTVRILAAPRLRAAEGKPTSLKIGTEVPIPITTFTSLQSGTSSYAPATSFQYRNVGVNLKLTPRVTPNGEITLEVAAEFSLLGDDRNVGTGQNPLVVPTFLTRNVEGILRLKDGETSLIGGLLQQREAGSFAGALGLQSIPILNKIFTSTQKSKDDSEILISITPHIVRAPKLTPEDLEAFYAGTKDVVRIPGARPPLLGAPEQAPSPSPSPTPVPIPALPATPAIPLGPTSSSPAPLLAPPASAAVPSPSPLSGAPAAVPAATAALNPPDSSVRTGETTAVNVVIVGARELLSLEMVLAYDPGVLEAIDVGSGPLLTLDGQAVAIEKTLEPGHVRAKFSRAIPAAGSGIVSSVRFKGLAPGTASVRLESITLVSTAGRETLSASPPARVAVLP